MSPTMSTPLSARSKSSTTTTPKTTATSEPGTTGAKRRSPSTMASDDTPTSNVRPWVSPRCGDHSPELLEEVALLLLDAEQLGHLADDDGQGEADDEALEHRLGDEVGEEPEAQQSGAEGEHAGHQGEHAGERRDVVGAARRQVGDRRRGQRRGRRHRPDDEVARAAERGVEDQRRRRGVEADDRRHAGDRGVGERLGHEHRPDGEPGDEVAAQPPTVVAGQRAEDRKGHCRRGLSRRRPSPSRP